MAAAQAQHLVALKKANAIRALRAELKREIYRGDSRLPDVIDPQVETEWDELAQDMKIGELLRSMKGWKHTRTKRFLTRFAGYPTTGELKLSELGPIRQAQLALMLREAGK